MSVSKVKFKYGTTSDFYLDVQQQVHQYFLHTGQTPYANRTMILKMIVSVSLYLGSYGLLLFYPLPVFAQLFLVVMMGLSYPSIFLNIAHDAAHHALFPNRTLNKLLVGMLELIGMNAYIFDYLHNRVHHVFTSIEGEDVIIEEFSILRLSQNQPYQSLHKYQVYYAPFVYGLFSLFLIFSMDFVWFKRKKMGNTSPVVHARQEYIKLYLFKAFYLFYILVIPMLVLDMAWWKIVVGFLLMQVVGGIILSIVGVLNHQIAESVFPEPDSEGYILNNKKNHELLVTIDFAPRSRMASWLFGGFNTHIAHHLFPHICHCHYPTITEMIRQTAPRYGLVYKSHSLAGAIRSHFRYLQRLSQKEASAEQLSMAVPS